VYSRLDRFRLDRFRLDRFRLDRFRLDRFRLDRFRLDRSSIYPAYVWGEYSMLDDIIRNGMQDCMNGIFGGGLTFQDDTGKMIQAR
jgi:hypothetical protein